MLALGMQRLDEMARPRPVPPFGRWGPGASEMGQAAPSAGERALQTGPEEDREGDGCLWAEVQALAPFAPAETRERLAEAVSLRGAALVGALLARFGDVDETLAALEDYAGAFDRLADFAADVFAERHPMAPAPQALNAEAMARAMVERGEVFALRLGADLHLFWQV